MPSSAEIRFELVDALQLNLVGPVKGHELESEVLQSTRALLAEWIPAIYYDPRSLQQGARQQT